MSTSTLRGHVNTMPDHISDGRRRRRTHSSEFKAQVVASCSHPGISIAAVAMANGVNANLARRWVIEAERCASGGAELDAGEHQLLHRQVVADHQQHAVATPHSQVAQVVRYLR